MTKHTKENMARVDGECQPDPLLTAASNELTRGAMRRDLFVYISGPMTAKHGFSIEENVAAGLRVYIDLLKQGIPAFCPHLGGAFPTAWSAVSWESWLAYDLAVIDRCTHVLMMPRWEQSAGAIKEKEYAEAAGVPVIYGIADLVTKAEGATHGA